MTEAATPPKRRGRPPGATGKAMRASPYPLRLTDDQRAKLERLGGARWLRAQIDAALESQGMATGQGAQDAGIKE